MIEVVLAVAIASIGIIAILGLLPNAIQSSRDATDNTLSATIAQDVFANIRSQPLNTVNFGNGPHDFTIPISTNSPVILNFDYTGALTNAIDYYQALISCQPQNNLSLSFVQVAIVWPARSAAPTATNIFISAVTQLYQ